MSLTERMEAKWPFGNATTTECLLSMSTNTMNTSPWYKAATTWVLRIGRSQSRQGTNTTSRREWPTQEDIWLQPEPFTHLVVGGRREFSNSLRCYDRRATPSRSPRCEMIKPRGSRQRVAIQLLLRLEISFSGGSTAVSVIVLPRNLTIRCHNGSGTMITSERYQMGSYSGNRTCCVTGK